MALSDVPGLAVAIIATLFLLRGLQDRRWLIAGCAMAGLAAGVRPQDAIVPLGVLAFSRLSPRPPQRERARVREPLVKSPNTPRVKVLLLAAGAFLGAGLAWAIPLAISLGGPTAAWVVLAGQSQYVGATDSLFARPLHPPKRGGSPGRVRQRLQRLLRRTARRRPAGIPGARSCPHRLAVVAKGVAGWP